MASLVNAFSYPDFVWLMNKSKIIITDSGGVQHEAPSLGKTVLVMRDITETPESRLNLKWKLETKTMTSEPSRQ